MYCQFCGSQVPETDQFCGQCGARVPAGAGQSGAPSQEQIWGERQADAGQPNLGADPSSAAAGQAPAEGWRQAYYDRDPNAPAMMPTREYAGFWIRFGAWLLDAIFAALLAIIPAIIFAVVGYMLVDGSQEAPLTFAQEEQQEEDRILGAIVGFFIVYLIISYAYQYIATSVGGGWGKRICSMRIIKKESGARPGYGTGAVRCVTAFVISMIGNIPLVGWVASLLNYLWMIWDPDKQTWHDKAAGTVVVRV
jgi:uncharacterized RDD family membrane protein YckC